MNKSRATSRLAVIYLLRAADSIFIESVRRRYDSQASSIGPHITIVSAFTTCDSIDSVGNAIEYSLRNLNSFPVKIEGVSVHRGRYLFLNVVDGLGHLHSLRKGILGHLNNIKLELQVDYLPHITLGRFATEEAAYSALDEVKDNVAGMELFIDSISLVNVEMGRASCVEAQFGLLSRT